MNNEQFWKTFSMGVELNIAGRFIYNGLHSFHEIDHFDSVSEAFEVLYNLSVGLERLLKVAVVLIEHNATLDQTAFEKSLITHSHDGLFKRITPKHDLRLSGVHNEILQILSKFYGTSRYGRYNTKSIWFESEEHTTLLNFFKKHLKIDAGDSSLQVPRNNTRMKKFLGKTIGKISVQLYELIQNEARKLNIFTHANDVRFKGRKSVSVSKV